MAPGGPRFARRWPKIVAKFWQRLLKIGALATLFMAKKLFATTILFMWIFICVVFLPLSNCAAYFLRTKYMATSLLVALWSPLTRPYHGKKVTPPWVGPLIGHERGPQGTDLDENFGTPYSLTRRIRK